MQSLRRTTLTLRGAENFVDKAHHPAMPGSERPFPGLAQDSEARTHRPGRSFERVASLIVEEPIELNALMANTLFRDERARMGIPLLQRPARLLQPVLDLSGGAAERLRNLRCREIVNLLEKQRRGVLRIEISQGARKTDCKVLARDGREFR